MFVSTYAGAVAGIDAVKVTVEVNLTGGGLGLYLVGLPDNAVKESEQRIRAAFENTGRKMSGRKVVVNLAPADLRKEGAGFDLPIAVGILAAMSEVSGELLPTTMFAGELSLDDAALRPYFSLENVREGAFSLANRLYGITFRPLVAPVYHKDCSVYEVLDVDGTHLGVLYFDFFPRSGKSSGAWCTAFRSQRYEGDERIAPVVAIVCNFTPPTKLTPSLLTLDEVQTLFHEFGHGLHALFADVKYRSLGRVEGDFVELPSQIMENWATEPEVLRHYAINYTTGEVIPERLIKRIRESGKFNQGFIVTELVAAALTDMDIHAITEYEPFDVNEFEADAVYGRRGLIPQIQPRYRYPYFLHIFDGGYASGYYFYIWAQVLDKDAFRAFEQTGDVFDRATARKFRTLLSRGGSADGMTLYRDFRGADPDKRAMLVACGLMEELPEEPADSLAVPVVTLEPNEKPKI